MDLSAKQELWEKLAGIEMRLQLMSKLIKINVGFADVEEFNLGLRSTLKNPEKLGEKQDRKTVRAAMEGKMHDELIEKRKSMREREDARRELSRILGKNTKPSNLNIRKEKMRNWIKYQKK